MPSTQEWIAFQRQRRTQWMDMSVLTIVFALFLVSFLAWQSSTQLRTSPAAALSSSVSTASRDRSSSTTASSDESHSHPTQRRLLELSGVAKPVTMTVFGFRENTSISRKQQKDIETQCDSHHLQNSNNNDNRIGEMVEWIPQFLTLIEQREFVQEKCPSALDKLDELSRRQQTHLAVEVWKYCALSQEGGAYVDSASPLLSPLPLLSLDFENNEVHRSINVAVMGQSYLPSTIHGSLLVLSPDNTQIASHMLELMIRSDSRFLEGSPLLLPRALYALIASQVNTTKLMPGRHPRTSSSQTSSSNWFLLELSCALNPLKRPTSASSSSSSSWLDPSSYRLAHHCPQKSGFCCSVVDTIKKSLVMMTRHPILPYQTIEETQLPHPYNAETGHYDDDELPFISTIREMVYIRPTDHPPTPNYFDTLMANECLPEDERCTKCLRDKTGANCRKCAEQCPCYCKMLCSEPVANKFIAKQMIVRPPLYSRDPNRIIPRIVHQTWFEKLAPDKYPNMSRLVESFRRSGWEYKFYSDEESRNFLSTHFPAEVREAYDALRPGAFKADLFRYCVLLIHGGIYADVDILLESTLDNAIPDDVGFMVPMDEPGIPVGKRMCLWNGLIAAAPGHAFLLKAIETVVNQVRNRFTAVDTDATFCPNPELSILHAFDTLFTAGPCLLGASLNRVLGREAQHAFQAGELVVNKHHVDAALVEEGLKDDGLTQRDVIGRTIILSQNKWDMGAHRFTWIERNLVVAATDLPESDDRANLKEKEGVNGGGGEHYSKTHAKIGIYGLKGLYVDKTKANEDIRMILDSSKSFIENRSVFQYSASAMKT